MSAPLRTRAEVEATMNVRARLLHDYRSRRAETVNRRDRVAGEPAEDVGTLDELLETWAMLARVPSDAVG